MGKQDWENREAARLGYGMRALCDDDFGSDLGRRAVEATRDLGAYAQEGCARAKSFSDGLTRILEEAKDPQGMGR